MLNGRCVQGHPPTDCYITSVTLAISGDNIDWLRWLFFSVTLRKQKEDTRTVSWQPDSKALNCRNSLDLWTGAVPTCLFMGYRCWISLSWCGKCIWGWWGMGRNAKFILNSLDFSFQPQVEVEWLVWTWVLTVIHPNTVRASFVSFPFLGISLEAEEVLFFLGQSPFLSSEAVCCGLASLMCQKMSEGYLEQGFSLWSDQSAESPTQVQRGVGERRAKLLHLRGGWRKD